MGSGAVRSTAKSSRYRGVTPPTHRSAPAMSTAYWGPDSAALSAVGLPGSAA
jgi:hypothetical protein